MGKLKGMAVISGLAALLALAVACGNGEASSSPEGNQTSSASPVGQVTASTDLPPTPTVFQRIVSVETSTEGPTPAGVPVVEEVLRAPGATYSPLLQTGRSQVGIWVTGQGTLTLEPDLALLNIGVETIDDTVALARDEAARAMDAIVTVLRELGVEDRDIQTRFFNISPQYEWQDVIELGSRTNKRVLVGYRVSNSAAVKIRDLQATGSIVDGVVTAGGDATRIDGIRFTVEDSKPFMTGLREAAVSDALAKAQQFASLTGVSLGRLVYVTETGGQPRFADFDERTFAMGAMVEAAPQTQIGGGELELRMTVQAVFDIQ